MSVRSIQNLHQDRVIKHNSLDSMNCSDFTDEDGSTLCPSILEDGDKEVAFTFVPPEDSAGNIGHQTSAHSLCVAWRTSSHSLFHVCKITQVLGRPR